MNCDVIGFVALDEILRFFFGGVMRVTFGFHIGNDFLHDHAANSTCFRVPFDVITTFERLRHRSVASERKMHPVKQWSGEERCQRCLQDREEYRVLALISRPASNLDHGLGPKPSQQSNSGAVHLATMFFSGYDLSDRLPV